MCSIKLNIKKTTYIAFRMYPHWLQKRKGKGSCPLVSKLRHNTMQMQPRTHCFCNYATATAVNLYLYSNLILHLHSIIRSVTERYTQYVTHSHSVFYTQTEPKCPICFRNHARLTRWCTPSQSSSQSHSLYLSSTNLFWRTRKHLYLYLRSCTVQSTP